MRASYSSSLLSMVLLACAAASAHAADVQAERNKQALQKFLDEMRVAGYVHHDVNEIRAIVERSTASNYVQHSKRIPPGREGLIKSYAAISSNWPPGTPPPDPGDLHFIADGDLVVWVSKKPVLEQGGGAGDGLMFQMVLFQDGRIAEHWDSLD